MGIERSYRKWRRWAAVLAVFLIGIPLLSATVIRSSGASERIRELANAGRGFYGAAAARPAGIAL